MEERNDKSKHAPAASLSPEFLEGGTAAGLEKVRARLLDLTNRNRLLNFRHTKGSIRVTDVEIQAVFARLLDEESLPLQYVPDPPQVSRGAEAHGLDAQAEARPTAAEHAASLGWNTSHDLIEQSSLNAGSRALPVLHYLEDLEILSRKVNAAARTAIEESGTNMLYLVFGFLEWYESDDSRQAHLAPLVTVPVGISRNDAKGKGFECRLEYSGEDIETNWSLVEKVRRDFGLEIPLIEEDDDPKSYFDRFQPVLAQKSRWRIRPQITLALLSFGKLLMYRDLDVKVWPAVRTHARVTELFEGRKNSTIAIHPDEHAIDDPRLTPDLPPLVVDADSSQHSALVDAMRGQNLVIEGPPGTGKSQTITNLIAAALAAGKTVLFVSEKLAALEVVRRRLDDVGLGLFCLELHSHKTKKNALLSDLEARLRAGNAFRHPPDFEQRIALVEEKKRALTLYAGLINKTIDPLGASVFDILWGREQAYQALPFDSTIVEHLLLPSVVALSGADLVRAEQFLAVYAEHLTTVLRCTPSLDGHPWAWVSGPLTFDGQEQLSELLKRTVAEISDTLEITRKLSETVRLEIPDGLSALSAASDVLKALPEPGQPFLAHVLAVCREPETRAKISAFVAALQRSAEAHQKLATATSTGNPTELLRREAVDGLRRMALTLGALGLLEATGPQLRQHLGRSAALGQLLAEGRKAFVQLTTVLGLELPFDIRRVELLSRVLAALEKAPLRLLHLRTHHLESEGAAEVVRQAAARASALLSTQGELDATFDVEGAGAIAEGAALRSHAAAIDDAGLWQRLFSSRYRAAQRAYRRIVRVERRVPRRARARQLRTLCAHIEALERFNADSSYRSAMGSHFLGVDTKWEDILAVSSWYESVLTAIPDDDVHSVACRELMLKSRSERLASLARSLPAHEQARTALGALVVGAPECLALLRSAEATDCPLSVWEQQLEARCATLADAVDSLETARVRPELPVSSVAPLLAIAERFQADLAFARSQKDVTALLNLPSYTAETVGQVKATLRLAEAVASGGIPRPVSEWLLHEEYSARLGQLRSWLSTLDGLGLSLARGRDQIRELASSRSWHEDIDAPLGRVLSQASRSIEHQESLVQWLHLQRSRDEAAQKGFSKLTVLAETGRITPQPDLQSAFRFVFYNTVARSVFADHPALFQFSGLTQDQIREQFARADRDVIRLSRNRAAAILSRRAIPGGHQLGSVKTWTDLGLITHEIKKQKRHIPIRQLVSRAGSALQAMKPCFMMGPLSVAQYLPPEKLKFDLIVMDEASQLKPEDAIGAIARGGQLVVVGDPKQLPPTNFFQRLAVDEEDLDDDELTALEESESILDVASTLYQPVRRLRWHYRSQHHSLIAFSNREFYQGDLVIFPSAYHESPDLGVKYHSVRGGIFEQRRNAREAAAVVEAVLDHVQRRPNESLGVVALNFEQRELIEELLDARLRSDPFALAYQERMDSGAEPLFIKNLENVQGDERDVIFISGTYGPDARGNQYQRFGPINGPNGHRRLNVLFTRARRRTEVFSSLDPDKIQTSAGSAFGLRALKQYLTFARTGVLEAADDGAGEPANDFERSVGSILKENGFEVVPQVGVAGFFVDLGVRHPTKAGAYLLGIECDGATYHSGRSARDRDRLREEILVNQGWKIHRIWSTDWFKGRNTEVSRLLQKLQALLADDPEHQLAMQRARKVSSLRSRLIALRDDELRVSFPDAPPEACLLRDSLLETFVVKRPKTRDDWFRVMSYQQRAETDSRQVGKYLEKVLQIIGDCSD